MQTEFINKRELTIPNKGPKALNTLLKKTEEGLKGNGDLDTVRLLHDSLAFLTEFFASFATGALKTVGPYSPGIEQLLAQPPSLDRAERLLTQAFLDWKAYPHHPAYESLREIFYLTSRLQSSRFAPRRHTRWLGVEGRAVAGLERLTRWSRRIDLAVSGGDSGAAVGFIEGYTPILWSWTDSLNAFFEGWTVEVSTEIHEGRLGLVGSASRDDVRLDFVPVQRLAGLKSLFASDGNGGVVTQGFVAPLGASGSMEAAVEAAPAAAAPLSEAEVGPPLVLETPSFEEPEQPPAAVAEAVVVPPVVEPEAVSPVAEVAEPVEPIQEAPLFAVEDAEPVASSLSAADATDELLAIGSLPGPDDLPDLTAPTEVPAPDFAAAPATPEFTAPPVQPEEVAVPDLGAPTEVPGPDFVDSAEAPAADFSAPAEVPAPDFAAAPVAPEFTAPPVQPEEVAVPDLGAPAEVPGPGFVDSAEVPAPDFSAPPEVPAPDFAAAPVAPAEVPGPDFVDSAEAPAADFSAPAEVPAPDFAAAPATPEFTAPPVQPEEVAAPDFGAPTEVPGPDFVDSAEAPAADFSAPAEVPAPDFAAAPVSPEFTTPPVQPEEVAAPDFGAPAEVPAPDFAAAPATPEFTAPPAQPEEVVAPDFAAPPATPEFTAPPAQPEEVAAPDFGAPAEVPGPDFVDSSEAPAPDFAAPAEVPAPDFAAAPATPEFTAPPVQPEEVAAPDFGAPAEVPGPDFVDSSEAPAPDFAAPAEVPALDFAAPPATPEFTAPPAQPEEVVAPDFSAPAEVSAPDFAAPPATPEFTAPPAQPEEVVAPDFAAPAEVPAPDFAAAPATPEFTAPPAQPEEVVDPDFAAPAEVPAPDFSAAPVAPEFTAPPAQPEEVAAPDFGAPAEVPGPDFVDSAEVPAPDFSAPAEVPAPDFSAAPVAPEFTAPPAQPEEVAAPDFGAPTEAPVPEGIEPSVEPIADSQESVGPVTVEVPISGMAPAPAPEPPQPEQTMEVQLPVSAMGTPVAPIPGSTDAGLFTANDEAFQFSDTNAPLFPVAGMESGVASSPFVAEAQPFQSVEMESSVGSARDMGASAEEILEDDYEFSYEEGPALPRWTGWSVDQREAVQEVCELAVGQGESRIPSVYAQAVKGVLSGPTTKAQIVIDRACGKTRLALDLALSLSTQDNIIPVLASWDRGYKEEHASDQLLRFYYELVRGKRTQRGQLALPEPESVTDLSISADRDGLEQAFQRLLGQIASINRKDIIFFLDEPPESIRRALVRVASPGLRFLCFLNPGDQTDGAGDVIDLRGKWRMAAVELFGDQISHLVEKPGATLLRLALANELINADCSVPEDLAMIEETVVEHESVSEELLAVLSLEDSPVSLDDLDQWFLEADAVTEAITAFPSLFELAKTRLSPVLSLTHPTVLKLVEEKYEKTRSKAARMLLGWVVAQLEKTNPDKYGGLQVREIVFRNFLRLYHFAKISADLKILEWVMRHKELQKKRVVLTSHLEKPGNRYELQTMLEVIVELLTELVDTGECDDLRDELAWAQSNLALNQLKLGQLPQAANGVATACELFETLVTKEKQYEFRPALSTTHYRASRIYAAQGDLKAATEFANVAVTGFVDLVEDRGRAELTPRLGVALAHRGSLFWDAQNSQAAKSDLERAAKLLDGSDSGDMRESFRTQIDIHLELVSIFSKENDFESAVRESGKAVQLATVAVEERSLDDFQPTLATCHAIRAKAYTKVGEQDRALRDIAKSISLRNLSVDEGRLEQRYYLAKDLQLRAQIFQGRGADDDAYRDLNRAIELLTTLQQEGRVDAAARLVVCLQERATLHLKRGQAENGIADLKNGLALAGDAPEHAEQKLKLLDSLLQAYLQIGDSQEALTVSQGLLAQYHAAQAWEPYSRVQLVRGEALERTGQYAQALECYSQASNLISQLLAQGQTDELLGRVSEAYLGMGSVELTLGRPANALPHVKRAIDVFTHLFQQRKSTAALPRLLKAYSVLSALHLAAERLPDAMQALKSGFDVLNYMEAQGGKGGVPTTRGLEKLKGEMYRLRAKALLASGDAQNALNDVEESSRNFLLTRQQPAGVNWKDELGRTWTLRSQILFLLKDFGQAESSIQDAIAHFEERLKEGHYEYFTDLMAALTVRAENSARSGKIDQVLEEYNRMLSIIASVAKSGASLDHEREMAKVLERRAQVYRDQGLLNEAYADYESVISLYRSLVTQKGRAELAEELVRVHLERAAMTSKAGHAQYSINDLSEAVNVSKALVSQGQVVAVPLLATALHRRAELFRNLGRPAEALTDLEGAIGFRSQLAQQSKDPELFAELGKSFLLQGTLLAAAGQAAMAAQSLDQSNGIFTSLVDQQGRKEFSSELAQGLITRVSLSSDRSDPALRQVLIKAVDLVAKQAKDGKPIGKDFTVECLRTVVELLQREDYDTVGSLIDSVLNLVETVVTDGRSEQDFVKLTDLLLAASAGLIDDRRTARRPHFLSLACVSCNREIQMFGKNSLPRLVYCLYELGQALERSKAPAVLNYVGSSFALLGELARQQETNEDFLRELKMMVSTWRSLPPQIPALANVSRHMLSQLLRLT